MRKQNRLTALLTCLLAVLLLATSGLMFGPEVSAVSNLGNREIEVVLSADAVSNNLSLVGFTDKLKADLLTRYGISSDRVHVTEIENQSYSGGDASGWLTFDHTNNSDLQSNTETELIPYYSENYSNLVRDRHIVFSNNDETISFYGYGSPAYTDFLLMENEDANNKIFTFTMNEANISYHTAYGAGFLFNAKYNYNDGNRLVSGYFVLIGSSQVYLYQVTDMNVATMMTSSATGRTTLLASATKPANTMRYLKLVASPSEVSLYQYTDDTYATLTDNGEIFKNISLGTNYGAFGFGPIAMYNSHNCSDLSLVTFDNLKMVADSSVKFVDMVRGTDWEYEDSLRLIANVDNDGVPDFGNTADLANNLYYMMQNNVHYVGWGLNNDISIGDDTTVMEQANNYIIRNGGHGTFINRSEEASDSLDEGVALLSDYIVGQLSDYPLVDKPELLTVFNDDDTVTCSTPTVQTNNGKSVATYEWRVMDVETGVWNALSESGQTTTLTFPVNTYNYVGLRIQEADTGLWSDYANAYVATDPNAVPVAKFTVDANELLPDAALDAFRTGTEVIATDASYHPAGEDLTAWEWIVLDKTLNAVDAMAQSFTSSDVPDQVVFDFDGQPAGKYTIRLRVQKGELWSDAFTQIVNVYLESDTITIARTAPDGGDEVLFANSQAYTFDVSSSGNTITRWRSIRFNENSSTAIVGNWQLVSAASVQGSGTITSSCDLYVQAMDSEGNSNTGLIGSFRIDDVTPVAEVDTQGYTSGTWSVDPVTLILTNGANNLMPVTLEINVDGAGWTVFDGTTVIDVVGTYDLQFRITGDNGKVSDVVSVTVKYDPDWVTYDNEDEGTGTQGNVSGGSVQVEEEQDPDVENITITLHVTAADAQDENTNFLITTADGSLDDEGQKVFRAFDIRLLKTVDKGEGGITTVAVEEDEITGMITIRIPVPAELDGLEGLGIVYIADDGTVTRIESTLVTIDGQDYLEFQTDHFSVYAIVGDVPPLAPATGVSGSAWQIAGPASILGAGMLLLVLKRLFNKRREAEI